MSYSHSHSNSPDHPHLHHSAPPPLPPLPPPAVAHNQITTANGCSGSSASSSALLHCVEDAIEVVQSGGISESHSSLIPSSIIITAPDEKTIAGLIESETQFMPSPDFPHRLRDQSIDSSSRRDSINWILKVHAHYNFQPVTALLSVNYLDRFLSAHSLPGNGWPFQLLSVACLSLAAKMEEPEVPLLLDLQVLDPGFLFEPKTIQRMELSVMFNLHWRLRSITPFDFLHYFISNLLRLSPQKLRQDCFSRIISASSDLILGSTRVTEFLAFPPSAVAAAAVLCAAGESSDAPASEGLVLHEKLNREMVKSCHQLMEDSLMDTCPSTIPPSPVGVLDAAACGSCDTRNENTPTSTSTQLLLFREAAERADHSYHQPPSPPPPPPPPPFPKRLRSSVSDVQQP